MREKVLGSPQSAGVSERVLVVGTTGDYIQWLRTQRPQQALFLTDATDRLGASEPAPLPAEEVVCDLAQLPQVRAALRAHLREHSLRLQGVACFDCDSMELAALLAAHFALSFPSPATIRLCRDKFLSKRQWQHCGVCCPAVRLVRQGKELYSLPKNDGEIFVLKPRIGTGSQLVFCCQSVEELGTAFRTLERKGCLAVAEQMVLEEWIDGPEYSCDCVVYEDRVDVLRVTSKVMVEDAPVGTVRGYYLSSVEVVDRERLAAVIRRGAHSLGLTCGVCMADFILRGQEIVLLEMTPRPGGDCLPQLLRQALQFDILSKTLDVARSLPVVPPSPPVQEDWVALRLHARASGFVDAIDTSTLARDPRVVEIAIIRSSGHLVILPPDDYESWYLGYVLFRPKRGETIAQQCRDLLAMVDIRLA